jgi:hypothetical protein
MSCTSSSFLCPAGTPKQIDLNSFLPAASTYLSTVTGGLISSSVTPIRGGPSLRLVVSPSDPTLLLAKAGNTTVGASSDSHSTIDPTSDLIGTNSMFILLLTLVIAAGLSIVFYRFIPYRYVSVGDMCAAAHKLLPGGVQVKRPTKLGNTKATHA